MIDPRSERFPAAVVAAVVVLLPLAHWGGLADPFALPRSILLAAAAVALLLHAAWRAARGTAPATVPGRFTLLAAGLIAAASIAAGISFNRGLAVRGWADLASLCILAWAASGVGRDPRAATRLLDLFLVPAALVAAGVLAQIFVPGFQLALGPLSILPPSPAGATFGDPGLAAQWLVLVLPLGVGTIARRRGALRFVAAAGFGLVVSALIFAGGPEAWVVGTTLLAVALAARVAQALLAGDGWNEMAPEFDGSALRAAAAAILVVILTVAVARLPGLPAPAPVTPMTHVGLLAPTSGEPSADRSAAVRGSTALIATHPAGSGPGLWRHAFLEVAWTRVAPSPFTLAHQAVHAGNGFLELAVETGVAGALLFVLLLAAALVTAWRDAMRPDGARRPLGLTLLLAIAAIVLVGCLGSPFQEATPAATVFIVIGLALPAATAGGPAGRKAPAYAAMAAILALALAAVPWFARRVEIARATLVAQSFLAADDPGSAIAAIDRPIVASAPDHLPHAILGNAYARRKEWQGAVDQFGAVLERSPWFLAARLGRAAAWQEMGRYDRAAEDLEAARQLWPQSAGTAMAMARLDERRGRLDAARAGYQNAVALDPTQADPWIAIGELDARRGRNDAAIDAFRKAAAINPRQPRVNLLIGATLEQSGLLELAVGYYKKAATLEPAAIEPRLKLANALHVLGKECEARESLQAARDLETDLKLRDALNGLIDQLEPACAAETARGGG